MKYRSGKRICKEEREERVGRGSVIKSIINSGICVRDLYVVHIDGSSAGRRIHRG